MATQSGPSEPDSCCPSSALQSWLCRQWPCQGKARKKKSANQNQNAIYLSEMSPPQVGLFFAFISQTPNTSVFCLPRISLGHFLDYDKPKLHYKEPVTLVYHLLSFAQESGSQRESLPGGYMPEDFRGLKIVACLLIFLLNIAINQKMITWGGEVKKPRSCNKWTLELLFEKYNHIPLFSKNNRFKL